MCAKPATMCAETATTCAKAATMCADQRRGRKSLSVKVHRPPGDLPSLNVRHCRRGGIFNLREMAGRGTPESRATSKSRRVPAVCRNSRKWLAVLCVTAENGRPWHTRNAVPC